MNTNKENYCRFDSKRRRCRPQELVLGQTELKIRHNQASAQNNPDVNPMRIESWSFISTFYCIGLFKLPLILPCDFKILNEIFWRLTGNTEIDAGPSYKFSGWLVF